MHKSRKYRKRERNGVDAMVAEKGGRKEYRGPESSYVLGFGFAAVAKRYQALDARTCSVTSLGTTRCGG